MIINLGIDGSTLPPSKSSLAVLSLAIVNPSLPLSVIALADKKEVDVLQVSPV